MNIVQKFKDLFSGESFALGLDIGTASIKAVKLRFLKDKVELSNFVLEPLQADPKPALKRIIEVCGINSAGISVSGSSTVVRYVVFLQMSEAELRQSLQFEAQQYIPFPIKEVHLDSYILKHGLPDNKMLVLVAAVKKELVDQRLKLFQETGFKISSVDFDSLALIKAFNFNYPKEENPDMENKAVALINIGAAMSNLNILEKGIPVFSRDIYIAGNNFTQKIQDILGLDPKSAEELKLNIDKERLEKVLAAAESVFSDLAKELRVSFDYYESQSASSVIKIYLSGGGSKFPGLKDMLANFLNIEALYWDPLKKISIADSAGPEKVKEISNQLAVAVGLALPK
jgi:type IV pilus assembly protein PilM